MQQLVGQLPQVQQLAYFGLAFLIALLGIFQDIEFAVDKFGDNKLVASRFKHIDTVAVGAVDKQGVVFFDLWHKGVIEAVGSGL